MTSPRSLDSAWWVLRIGLGLGVFLAGLDKYFNILTTWEMYLSSFAEAALPVSPGAFMHLVGVVEMGAGLALLAGRTRTGGYIVAAWLVAIAINLVTTGLFYDLAVRDVEMALGAFALARITEARAALSAGQDDVRRRAA